MDNTQVINLLWLLNRGWTARQAARKLKVSHGHLSAVLRGERKSNILCERLRALPARQPWEINLRERIAK